MSCRTNCCKKFMFICALLALTILATPAFAGNTCLQDEYNNVSKQKLNCTANDVRVAEATNIRDLNGAPLTTCFEGTTFSFIADFEIVTSSTSSRSNIGLYFATDNQTSALAKGGSCVDNIIPPVNHPCAGAPSVTCGSDVHNEFDTLQPDNCGDTSSQDNGAFGAGSEKVTVVVDNFQCKAPAGQTGTPHLVLPNCTSWQIPGGTIQCNSPASAYPWVQAAIPGTPSKCNCGTIDLAITPVTVTPTVQKACTTTKTPGPAAFTQNPSTQSPTSCDAGAEGSTVTYTVAITNTSTTPNNNVVVDQICDNRYGNVFTASGFTPACTTVGTIGTVASTNCPPSPIAPGATGTCIFTAVQGEDATVTDTVNASGHSSINASSTFGPTSSNSVSATSTDAPSTATIDKEYNSTKAGCATVRYDVDVSNTSAADENLTLNSLTDTAYGDVTKLGSGAALTVLGTTCGVANGIGTLTGTTGAGVLPASLPVGGADYKCQFDAQFCGGLDAQNCFQHSNKVNGSFTADEAADTVTLTNDTLTVKECLTATPSTTIP